MSNIKTILTQSAKITLYSIVSVGLGFLSNLVYTHYLSPEVFGNFTLTRTIINFLPLISLLGFHKGLLRQGSIALGGEKLDLYGQIRNYTISFSIITGLSACILTILSADVIADKIFNNPGLATQIRLFSFIIPVMVSSNMVMSLYQVNKKADTGLFLYQVVYFSLLLIVFLFCTLFLKGEALITVSFLTGHILYWLLLVYHERKLGYRFSTKIEKSEKSAIFKISIPQFLSAIFNQSQKWTDTLFLGILGTSREVGIYYIGLKISGFVSIPAVAMNNIFIPIAARLIGQKKHNELNDLYKTVTRIIFVFGSLTFGAIFFLKTFLIDLFGKGYESSTQVILIILISETIDFGVGPARQLITMSGGGKINMVNSIATLTISIVSSYLLIPRYGIIGAALANALTNATLQIITVIELMVIYKLSPFNKKYFLIMGLFLVTIFSTAALPLPDIFKLIIFLIILGTLYFAVVINKQERDKIKSLVTEKRKRKSARAKLKQEA